MPPPLKSPPSDGPKWIYCIDCGYDLQGLPAGECPECGRPFDPDVFSSYTSFYEPPWTRWLPERRVGYGIAGAVSVVVGRLVLLGAMPHLILILGFLYPFWIAGTTALLMRAAVGGRTPGYLVAMALGVGIGGVLSLPDFPVGTTVAVVLGAATGFFYAYADGIGMIRG